MTSPIQKNVRNSGRRVIRIDNWIHACTTSGGEGDDHVSFLFYWIAYEAAYQQYDPEGKVKEYKQRKKFHENIADSEYAVDDLQFELERCKEQAEKLLALRQANRCFWKKGEDWSKGPTAWKEYFVESSESAISKLTGAIYDSRDIPEALNSLFDNLSIVRHQIVHGGSSGESSFGKHQVTWGNEILRRLIPVFRDCIDQNKTKDWGNPPFPRVGKKADEECLPPWMTGET